MKKKSTTPSENISLPTAPASAGKRSTPKKSKTSVQELPAAENDALEEVLDTRGPEEEPITEEPIHAAAPTPPPQKLSILQRLRLGRQRKEEAGISSAELIQKKTGLSKDDLVVILELGYESELENLVGSEMIKRLKNDYRRQQHTENNAHYRTAFGYRGSESIESIDATTAAYRHDRKRLLWRLLPTVLCSLLLFLIEIPLPAEGMLGELLSTVTTFTEPLGLLLFALCAFLSYRPVAAGTRDLLNFSPTPYSILTPIVPTVLLYDLAAILLEGETVAVNFAASLPFLTLAVCDLLRLCCELRTVRQLGNAEEQTVLCEAVPNKKKLRRGNKIVKLITENNSEPHYRIARTGRTAGFFRRCNDFSSAARSVGIHLTVQATLSLLVAVIVSLRTPTLTAVASAFMTTLLATAPISACFGYFFPLCRANRLLACRQCALIGEESVCEMSESKTVIFRDSHLYSAEKTAQISVRHGDDLRTDIRLVSALFRRLGGALATVGDTPAARAANAPVSIVRIQGGGVEAMVDGRHLLVGDAEFLQKSGVRIPAESTDAALRRGEQTAELFVAVEGTLKLCYEIQYRTNPSFEALLRDLAEDATSVSILSYDPCLNEAFLQKSRPASAEHVGILKPARFEEERVEELCDTGVIAQAPEDVAYPLHAAAAIRTVRLFSRRIQLIASLIGGGAVLLYTLLANGATVPSLLPALYQLFWIPVTVIAARSELNPDKLHLKKH